MNETNQAKDGDQMEEDGYIATAELRNREEAGTTRGSINRDIIEAMDKTSFELHISGLNAYSKWEEFVEDAGIEEDTEIETKHVFTNTGMDRQYDEVVVKNRIHCYDNDRALSLLKTQLRNIDTVEVEWDNRKQTRLTVRAK